MNYCRGCEQDFSSVSAFDRHRVGTHAYLYGPGREDGRRCIPVDELEATGFRQNARGRWEIAADADRARTAFARSSGGAK